MHKSQPGVTPEFLEEMKARLRAELRPLLIKAQEEERPDTDQERVGATNDDYASVATEKYIQGKLREADMARKRAIEEALERIQKGTYGTCRDCGDPISKARLTALPYAPICIDCKRDENKDDKGRPRRDSVARNGHV